MNKLNVQAQNMNQTTIDSKYDKVTNVSVKVGYSIGQVFVVRLA